MPVSDAQKRASAKYNQQHTRLITLRLLLTTDADILSFLDSLPNKQGYIKALIRADIAQSAQKEEED